MASGGASNGLDQLAGIGKSIGDVFISLSAEYPALLDTIIIIFGAIGVCVGCSAIFDFLKMGKRDQMQESPAKAVMWKLISGGVLVDLAFWTKVTTSTLWDTDPLGISSYTGNGGGDYGQTALMAALGFIVLAGYVVLGKAFIMTGKLGYLSPESRSDLAWSIIARIIAGGTMVACMNVSEYLNNSTGFNWLPS
ncbi:hypothetical protein ACR3H8_20495 [Pseudomonas aeruginosa]|uniref:hypothetical protein n=1 Tax=Pseudomonas aeruginosa group TaxID=136841 RepID=UPI000939D489|nr:hypothetical protein [Pseudomonas aeruginosa]ELD5772897.1 hypothetical protein [Pseudomonas aeruginosa]MBA5210232.1 hypothetical protein [Pseudomonas aeruginosa]MBG3916875.1 hypothetical protein [Pseudomonas aeruginosa]MBG4468200.1 hypothetical protein [Pseudomonas aeruginosa]MBG4606564.1 hypothetical protein [Pseudomonas aeruginosa]